MARDKTGKQQKDERASPQTQQASLLLSGLVLTPDSALEVFRERRAANAAIDLDQLRRARDILDAVAAAITSTEPEVWTRIERAWEALQATEATAAGSSVAPGHGERPSPAAEGDDEPEPAARPVPRKPPAPPARPVPRKPPDPPPPPVPRRLPEPPPPPAAPAPVAAAEHSPAPPAAVAAPSTDPDQQAKAAMAARGIDIEALNRVSLDESEASTVTMEEGAASNEALPFQGAASPPPPAVESTGKGKPPLGETVDVDTMSPLTRKTLPFDRVRAVDDDEATKVRPVPTRKASESNGSDATARASASSEPGLVDDSSTVDGPLSGSAEPTARLARGAPAPLEVHLAAITLEQHAALCAECDLHPHWTASIHARYNITSDEQRALLDRHWRARLEADGELAQSWRWHYQRHEEWVRQNKS